jgi:hypothetical protein
MALIKCPRCGGAVSDKASACPHCRSPVGGVAIAQGGATRTAPVAITKMPDRSACPRPQREAVKKFLGIAIGAICIGFLLFQWFGGGTSKEVATPISNTSFVDFDAKFCVHSRLTDLQKSNEIKGYKGQRVRWEGIVSYVSDDSVGFKHKATTSTYDVLLRVAKSDRPDLTSLNQGDLTTYEGTIDDYGMVMAHGLSDGKIINHRALSSNDQMMFLVKTETAVMERMGGTGGN